MVSFNWHLVTTLIHLRRVSSRIDFFSFFTFGCPVDIYVGVILINFIGGRKAQPIVSGIIP